MAPPKRAARASFRGLGRRMGDGKVVTPTQATRTKQDDNAKPDEEFKPALQDSSSEKDSPPKLRKVKTADGVEYVFPEDTDSEKERSNKLSEEQARELDKRGKRFKESSSLMASWDENTTKGAHRLSRIVDKAQRNAEDSGGDSSESEVDATEAAIHKDVGAKVAWVPCLYGEWQQRADGRYQIIKGTETGYKGDAECGCKTHRSQRKNEIVLLNGWWSSGRTRSERNRHGPGRRLGTPEK